MRYDEDVKKMVKRKEMRIKYRKKKRAGC